MAEACYVDRYLPASYKFVTFDAIDVTSEHGRRGAEGEFPFGEQTAYADLGRKIRRYTVRGRFVRNSHILGAAALIAVCELPGPGILVHPTRGVLTVACTGLKVTDDLDNERGVTIVDMQFVEANVWPNGLSLVGQILGLILGTVIGPSRDNFTSRYRPNAIQPFREEAVVRAAQAQISNIRTEYLAATVAGQPRDRFAYDLESLSIDREMASDTSIMDRGIAVGMQLVSRNLSNANKFSVFRRIANNAALQSTFSSPASDAENAIYSNVRVIAAAYMAEGAFEENNLRSAEIFAQVDAIDAILEGEMAYAGDICANRLYLALSEFRVSTSAALYNKAYNAPGFTQFNFSGGVHALTAAYSIYGDAKRHREIEMMNLVSISGRVGPFVTAVR